MFRHCFSSWSWLAACAAICGLSGAQAEDGIHRVSDAPVSVEVTGPSAVPDSDPSAVRTTWNFATESEILQLFYSRAEQETDGKVLPTTDLGFGLGPKSWEHWYRNNFVRVLVGEDDILATHAPTKVDVWEGETAFARFEFPTDSGPLALWFAFPADGASVGVVADFSALQEGAPDVTVLFNAYPGGFASVREGGDGLRVVQTQTETIENDPTPAGTAPFHTRREFLPNQEDLWFFYSDKIANRGPVGLVLAEPATASTIELTNYQVQSRFTYPASAQHAAFALFAHNGSTFQGWNAFKEALKTLPKWAESLPGEASSLKP